MPDESSLASDVRVPVQTMGGGPLFRPTYVPLRPEIETYRS